MPGAYYVILTIVVILAAAAVAAARSGVAYARVLALSTLVLIGAGGLVTSTGSGLSVPDWPNSYGYNMFTFPPSMWVGGIRYEHGHRLIASTVGLLTIGLCVVLRLREPRRWVRQLGIAALVAVCVQGILGGITVRYFLPAPVSVAHACLAQAFFALTVALAVFVSPSWREETARPGKAPAALRGVHRLAIAAAAVVYVQLILGAIMRHTGAGLAIPDFPLALGRVVPPFESREVAFHFAHRAWAVVVAGVALALVGRALAGFRRDRRIAGPAILLGVLVVAQVALGAATVLTRKAVLPTTAHVATGAAILGLCVAIALRAWRPAYEAAAPAERRAPSKVADYLALTKPRVTALVMVTTCVGFYLAAEGPLDWRTLAATLLGTGLLASGTAALNQWWERDHDRLMARTKDRPLPAGRIAPNDALAFGAALGAAGLSTLLLGANALTAGLGALTFGTYLFAYTPLKRTTHLCTLVGCLPGALPPVMGWAGARGELDLGALALFAILFVWQLPHFFAIAWVYRDDYARAGYRMLTVVDPAGQRAARQIAWFSALLVAVSVAPSFIGVAGPIYLAGALALGLGHLAVGLRLSVRLARGAAAARASARGLFLASLVYLPALFGLLTADRIR